MNDKPQRNEDIIFGLRPIIEAINSGKDIEKVLIKNGLEGDLFKEFYELVKKNNIPFQYVPVEKLDRVTRNNHQGVVAYISPIAFQDIEKLIETWLEDEAKMPVILVLDQITDIRNFGAIVRTAECAGVDAVVIPSQGAARINADAVKTSAGALHHMPICKVKNIVDVCMLLQQSGIEIVAATEKAKDLYTNVDFTDPVAIVMGSEDRGIDKRILAMADHRVKIPIHGKIESLNVSVASGLLVYEVVRQRSL